MEDLPGDVLLVLLRKLAAQDPVSLLRATCASKLFHRATEENPVLWKEAFLGLAPAQEKASFDAYVTCAELDEEVDRLGGYKQLALIKAGRQRLSTSDPVSGFEESIVSSFDDLSNIFRFLALFRQRGDFLWAAGYTEKPKSLRRYLAFVQLPMKGGRGSGGFYGTMSFLDLVPVFLPASCNKAAKWLGTTRGQLNAEGRSLIDFDSGKIMVEVFISLNRSSISPGKALSQGFKPRNCRLLIDRDASLKCVVVAEAQGFLVFEEPDPVHHDWLLRFGIMTAAAGILGKALHYMQGWLSGDR